MGDGRQSMTCPLVILKAHYKDDAGGGGGICLTHCGTEINHHAVARQKRTENVGINNQRPTKPKLLHKGPCHCMHCSTTHADALRHQWLQTRHCGSADLHLQHAKHRAKRVRTAPVSRLRIAQAV